ncbi:hypothetical protein ACFU99_12065 [Streptomyces sp. NPDC057654]|uniref:hypothetical protein n=1 Tax=Streptomyces sp. NPDC057654 TaxID=3346196 RepID=UPI003687C28B
MPQRSLDLIYRTEHGWTVAGPYDTAVSELLTECGLVYDDSLQTHRVPRERVTPGFFVLATTQLRRHGVECAIGPGPLSLPVAVPGATPQRHPGSPLAEELARAAIDVDHLRSRTSWPPEGPSGLGLLLSQRYDADLVNTLLLNRFAQQPPHSASATPQNAYYTAHLAQAAAHTARAVSRLTDALAALATARLGGPHQHAHLFNSRRHHAAALGSLDQAKTTLTDAATHLAAANPARSASPAAAPARPAAPEGPRRPPRP